MEFERLWEHLNPTKNASKTSLYLSSMEYEEFKASPGGLHEENVID